MTDDIRTACVTVLLTEYGCCACQRHHRRGIDPEYEPHLARQSKHGPRQRIATVAERFALAVGPLEFTALEEEQS